MKIIVIIIMCININIMCININDSNSNDMINDIIIY